MSECTCDPGGETVSVLCPVHGAQELADHRKRTRTRMILADAARRAERGSLIDADGVESGDSSRIVRALDELGLRDTQEARDILNVFVQCMLIYEERNKTRGLLWQRVGWKESLANARSKMTRVLMAREKPELVEMYFDDAYDLINFTVFFILNAHAGRSEWQA